STRGWASASPSSGARMPWPGSPRALRQARSWSTSRRDPPGAPSRSAPGSERSRLGSHLLGDLLPEHVLADLADRGQRQSVDQLEPLGDLLHRDLFLAEVDGDVVEGEAEALLDDDEGAGLLADPRIGHRDDGDG